MNRVERMARAAGVWLALAALAGIAAAVDTFVPSRREAPDEPPFFLDYDGTDMTGYDL